MDLTGVLGEPLEPPLEVWMRLLDHAVTADPADGDLAALVPDSGAPFDDQPEPPVELDPAAWAEASDPDGSGAPDPGSWLADQAGHAGASAGDPDGHEPGAWHLDQLGQPDELTGPPDHHVPEPPEPPPPHPGDADPW